MRSLSTCFASATGLWPPVPRRFAGKHFPRFSRRAFSAIALCTLLTGWMVAAAAAADAPQQSVSITVDYGDGAQLHLDGLAWKSGMTVLDAVEAAGAHPHGVKFKLRGSGSTAFVTQIGDTKNEGGGAKNRNWIYWVDNQQAEVGIGAYELKPRSAILWKFDTADYNR